MRAGIIILALVGLLVWLIGLAHLYAAPGRASREENSGRHGADTICRIDLRGKELGSILIVDTDVPLVGQKLKLWPAARHSVSAVMAASVAMVTETSLLPSP